MAQHIGFVGAGNMASALVSGFIAAGGAQPHQLRCFDTDKSRCEQWERSHGVSPAASNLELVRWADIVLLAVKPQSLPAVLVECREAFRDGQLVISVCAGIQIAAIREQVDAAVSVVRAMPNTPAFASAGATAIAAEPSVSDEQLEFAQGLFESVGICRVVPEAGIDAVTGLSGSGPAYVLMAIEALAEGGVRAGLPRAVALDLATQTFFGTAKLLKESGEHPAVLKDQVTSPGGTTAAGTAALERAGLRASFIDAVLAATQRSRELGRG